MLGLPLNPALIDALGIDLRLMTKMLGLGRLSGTLGLALRVPLNEVERIPAGWLKQFESLR